MKKIKIILVYVVFTVLSNYVNGQVLTIKVDSIETVENQEICLDVLAGPDFIGVAQLQMSIHWDPSILEFIDVQSQENVTWGNSNSFPMGVANIIVDYTNPIDTLLEGDPVFCLPFQVIGEIGDCSPVSIESKPLTVLFLGCCSEVSSPISPNFLFSPTLIAGAVKIVESLNLDNVEITDVSCHGETSGSILVDDIGGVAPYIYEWTGPNQFSADSESLLNLGAGIYFLTITDFNGVSVANQFTISEPLPLHLDLIAAQPNCGEENGSISFQVSGGTLDYSISVNGAQIDSTSIANLDEGEYEILILDGQNCEIDTLITLVNVELPEVSLQFAGNAFCEGELDTIVATSNQENLTFSWLQDGVELPNEIGDQLIVSQSGVYQLIAINEQNCEATDTIEFSLNEIPEIEIMIDNNENACEGDTILLQLSGDLTGNSILWNTNETASSISVTESNMYQVDVGNGNCIASDTVNIVLSLMPDFSLIYQDSICEGDEVTIFVESNQPLTYLIVGSQDTILQTSENSIIFSPEQDIEFIAVNDNSCELSESIQIEIYQNPTVSVADSILFCQGDEVNVTAEADGVNLSFIWNDGVTSVGRMISSPGAYSVTATNSYNCSASDSLVALSNEPFDINIDIIPSNCNEATGAINYDLDGGIPPFSEELFSTFALDSLTTLSSGDYTLIVTDYYNCVLDTMISIPEAGQSLVEIIAPQENFCEGDTVILQAVSSDTIINYNWSNNEQTSSIAVFASGNYEVTILNEYNCESSGTYAINFLDEVNPLITATDSILCSGDTTFLTGMGGDYFQWESNQAIISPLDSQSIIVVPENGNELLTLLVGNTCNQTSIDFEVEVLEVLGGVSSDTCIGIGGVANLTAFGGVAYSWEGVSDSDGANTIVSPVVDSFFPVTITDEFGCTQLDTVFVSVLSNPLGNIKPISIISPNGDRKNETLEFQNLEKFPNNNLKVFNRWGVVVYEKVGYQDDADRFSGENLQAGVYYYVLDFLQGSIKSSLTIVREKK